MIGKITRKLHRIRSFKLRKEGKGTKRLLLNIIFSVGLVIFLALSANAICSFAGEEQPAYLENGVNYYINTDTNTAYVKNCGGAAGDIIIKSSITVELENSSIEYPVVEIYDGAFLGNDSITSVNFGNSSSITTIGEEAFNGCTSLTSITIPGTVAEIGTNAFNGCSSLTSITIPSDFNMSIFNNSGITVINDDQFTVGGTNTQGTFIIEAVNVDPQLCGANLTWEIFVDNSGSCTLTITGSGDMYDYDENNLAPWENHKPNITEVILPDGITKIGTFAFYNCSSLTSIAIPNSVTTIGEGAFNDCTSLTSITIPGTVAEIGTNAFNGCSSLTSIEIPNGFDKSIFSGSGIDVNPNNEDEFSVNNTSVTGYFQYVGQSGGNENSGTCGDNLQWNISEEDYDWVKEQNICRLIITGSGDMYDYNQNDVPWENYKPYITEVILSDGITKIGANAFFGCESLTKIIIQANDTSVGNNAFSGCTSLMSIFIKDKENNTLNLSETGIIDNTIIWKYTEGGSIEVNNTYDESIVTKTLVSLSGKKADGSDIPSDNSIIIYCNELGENYEIITVPQGVRLKHNSLPFNVEIDGITWKCNFLEGNNVSIRPSQDTTITGAVTIPSTVQNSNLDFTVTAIDKDAFSYCSSLTSITIPNSVTSIVQMAFTGCTNLTSANIPSSITTIGEGAFSGCSSLTSITIPNSVTSIGQSIFMNCKNLNSANIPSGITTIADVMFGNCSSLTNITIPESVTSIGQQAFAGCSSLTKISIPESVTSIGPMAFAMCNNLTSITIPKNVTTIGPGAFMACDSLESINVDENNSDYSSKDGVLFSKDGKTLICYPAGKTDTSYEIPETVTSIDAAAFTMCNNLKSIIIPKSVTSIGQIAFMSCINLENINIPSQLTEIKSGAFKNCVRLQNINIPSSVTTISNNAFNRCNSLVYNEYENIYYLGNNENPYLVLVKAKDTNVTSLQMHENTKIIMDRAFDTCNALTEINISEESTEYSLEDGVLYNKDKTTLIYYPKGKTNTSFVLPQTVTEVPDGVFDNSNLIDIFVNENCGTNNINLNNVWTYKVTGDQSLAPEGKTFVDIIGYGYSDQFANDITCGAMGDDYVIRSADQVLGISLVHNCGKSDDTFTFTDNNNMQWDCTMKEDSETGEKYISIKPASSANQEATYVIVPATVENGCMAYVVKEIGENAFLNYQNLKNVFIEKHGDVAIDVSNAGIRAQANVWKYEVLKDQTGAPEGKTLVQLTDKISGNDDYVQCNTMGDKYVIRINLNNDNIYVSHDYCGLHNSWEDSFEYTIGEITWECNIIKNENEENTTNVSIKPKWGTWFNVEDITIPSVVENGCISYTVKKIKDYAFRLDGSEEGCILKTVTFEDSSKLEEIGIEAFQFCKNLEEITNLPASLTSIGTRAFNSCEKLKTVTFAEGSKLTSIGIAAFSHCSALQEIYIPASVTKIENSAFVGCTSLENVNFEKPSQLTTIEARAFERCSKLQSIEIPASVTSIEPMAFSQCTALKEINVNSENTAYSSEDGVLYSKDKKTLVCYPAAKKDYSFTVPASVTNFANLAISDCKNLKTVKFEDGSQITEISMGAFYTYPDESSSSLETVIIPKSVTKIGEAAFIGCNNLKNVIFEENSNLTEIGNVAFGMCTSLKNINLPESVTTIGKNEEDPPDSKMTGMAFMMCSGLESITIPKNVTTIGPMAFAECSNLKDIYVPDMLGIPDAAIPATTRIWKYSVENNAAIITGADNKNKFEVVYIPENIGNYQVKTIGDLAFEECSDLTSVTIPSSVTTIGESAFVDSSNLENVYIPNTANSVADNAFDGTKPTNKWIYEFLNPQTGAPEGKTLVKINSVTKASGTDPVPTEIACDAMGGNYLIRSVEEDSGATLTHSCGNPDQSATSFDITTEDGITWTCTFIGSSRNVSIKPNLANSTITGPIKIPSSVTCYGYPVTKIENSAFTGCTGLTSVVIPESVTSIGNLAFNGCNKLTNINIPEGISVIGDNAFRSCTNLERVVFEDTKENPTLSSIGTTPFSGCTNLNSVYIGNNNTTLESKLGNTKILKYEKLKEATESADGKTHVKITVVTRPISVTYDAMGEDYVIDSVENTGGCAAETETGWTVNGEHNYSFKYNWTQEENTWKCTETEVCSKCNESAEGSETLTITPYIGTYDGQEHDIVTVSGTIQGATLLYSVDGKNWSATVPTYQNAGNYKVYVKMQDDENYVAVTARIDKAETESFTVTNCDVVYDGQPHGVTVTNESGRTIEYMSMTSGDWSTTELTQTDVGKTLVYVKLNGDENHYDTVKTATITIRKVGDVNGDGSVDIIDLQMLYNHLAGVKALEGEYAERAKAINNDDEIDVLDLKALFNIVAG